jgi:hypothetical protein
MIAVIGFPSLASLSFCNAVEQNITYSNVNLVYLKKKDDMPSMTKCIHTIGLKEAPELHEVCCLMLLEPVQDLRIIEPTFERDLIVAHVKEIPVKDVEEILK